MKKILAILLFIGASILNSRSQTPLNSQAHLIKSDSVNHLLLTRFSKIIRNKKVDVCLTSAIFAKFSISAKGKIVNLKFYENGAPVVFKEILNEFISSTEGLWVTSRTDGIAVESIPIIYPLIFQMEASCNVVNGGIQNFTDMALLNLFREGNIESGAQYILLAPLFMNSNKD